MTTIDMLIVALYAIGLFGLAQWVSRDSGQAKTTEDYFLAGRTLPWWAIGASLIAANISAEQIIGQSGQGFVVGLAIAAYEWQAALVLLVVAKYFLPIFLKREIYTMPQFLQTRYGTGVKSLMSFYWIVLLYRGQPHRSFVVRRAGDREFDRRQCDDSHDGACRLRSNVLGIWWPESGGIDRYYSGRDSYFRRVRYYVAGTGCCWGGSRGAIWVGSTW